MAGKRKYQEAEHEEIVHESRKIQVYGDKTKASTEPPRAYSRKKQQQSLTAVNDIKKKIRDVRRRLERLGNLPADVRMEDERALTAYEQELAAAEAEKFRQKMIHKYHMVRFFGI